MKRHIWYDETEPECLSVPLSSLLKLLYQK